MPMLIVSIKTVHLSVPVTTVSLNGFECDDIDQRVEGGHNCGANAACTNTIGGWTCACNTGYEGDGVGCVDFDE